MNIIQSIFIIIICFQNLIIGYDKQLFIFAENTFEVFYIH